MIDAETIARLRILRGINVGSVTFKKIIEIFGNALNAINNLHIFDKKAINLVEEHVIRQEIERTYEYGAEIVCWDNKSYPLNLRSIYEGPPIIIAKGNLDLLNASNMIAVVGSRNASAHGINLTKRWCSDIIGNNGVIVSGLARGIDTAAHLADVSKTIAVIASGIDVCYPKDNIGVKLDIEDKGGLVITEYAFSSEPIAQKFPQRNRVIAGLSHATVVMEASLKSGSLITAGYASKYKKPLFAVPGSPADKRYEGCNSIIKSGEARLITSVDQIFDALNSDNQYNYLSEENIPHMKITSNFIPSKNVLDKYRDTVYNAISFVPISIDEIVAHTGIDYDIINVLILEMELLGTIERLYGNYIVKV